MFDSLCSETLDPQGNKPQSTWHGIVPNLGHTSIVPGWKFAARVTPLPSQRSLWIRNNPTGEELLHLGQNNPGVNFAAGLQGIPSSISPISLF